MLKYLQYIYSFKASLSMNNSFDDTSYQPDTTDLTTGVSIDTPDTTPYEAPSAYDTFLEEKSTYTQEDQDALYGDIEGFLGDSTQSKTEALAIRKAEKLNRLGEQSQFSSLSSSYTELGDGTLESNANKIWNDLSGAEYTSLYDFAVKDLSLGVDDQGYFYKGSGERYEGPVRRSYGYNTKTSDEAYKFGVARGDRSSSDTRYTDYEVGADGVDVNKKQHDILLPEYMANTLEALGHGRREALKGRLVPDALDIENYDRFGGGATEYYKSKNAFFGDPTAENYGTSLDSSAAKELLYNYATEYTTPSKYYRGQYSDDKYMDAYYGKVAEAAAQDRYENQTALDEALQVLSGFPAGVAKGALELVDAAQEAVTYLPQLAARLATGDSALDIDLFDDGYKKAIIEFTDDLVGYDRKLDEVTLSKATQELTAAGVDITSWESIKSAIADPEKRAHLGAAAWKLLSDPSLTVSMVTEMIGSGGALGAITKTASKATAKFAAKADSKVVANAQQAVSGALKSNLDKLKTNVAAATSAGDLVKVAELQKNYNILQKVPDLLKGSVYTNADMMVRMNKDITAFKENNEGSPPNAAKLLQMALANRVVSMAEVMSLKSIAGIKDVPARVLKEATKKGVIMASGDAAGRLAKNGLMEGTQETVDSIVEQINQKLDTISFEGKTIPELLSEASAEILTGTFAGMAGGVQIGTGKLALDTVGAITKKPLGSLGKKVLKKGTKEVPAPATDLSEEDLAVAVGTADTTANSTVGKYSAMFGDEEVAKLLVNEDLETEQEITTPELDTALEEAVSTESTYADMISEIEAAEVVLEDRQATPRKKDTDGIALKMLRKAKAQAAIRIIESEELPVLGSGYSPEDLVDDFIDAKTDVSGNLDITEEEKAKVNTFLKKNGQKPFRFERVQARLSGKDAAAVYEESMGTSANSAPSRRARLRRLVNTPGVNKALISKELGQINNFLTTQLNRRTQYSVTEKEVQKDIDAYNNRKSTAGKDVGAPKSRAVEGLPNNKIIVEVGSDGKYKIAKPSRAILNSLDDTIDHLQTTLTRYNKATAKVLGVSSSTTIDVPATTSVKKTIQEAREKDKKYYDSVKPTKVIVDNDTSSKQWQKGGDYHSLNETKIVGAKEFTADDVVLLTTLDIKAGSSASRRLAAAIAAGATIVVDRQLQEGNSKAINTLAKAYNAGAVTVEGKSVWRPIAEATEIRAAAAVVKKEGNKKALILSNLVKAFDQMFIEKGNASTKQKENATKAQEAAIGYFEGDTKKLNDYVLNNIRKEAAALEVTLEGIVLKEGRDSKEYSEAVGKATASAYQLVEKKAIATEERLSKGSSRIKEWKNAAEVAKKGGEALVDWVKKVFGDESRSIATAAIKNSLGKDKAGKTIYSYWSEERDDYVTTTILKEVETFSADGTYTIIEVDPDNYVEVSEATVLNTLSVEDLKVEGLDGFVFNAFVEDAVEEMGKAISSETDKETILPFSLIDSSAVGLLYDKDKNINPNLAVAAKAALYNFIKHNQYLLSKDSKTLEDIAQILGKHPSELSKSAITAMQDNGLLTKMVADSMGKEILALMGMSRKNTPGVDLQAFSALTTGLGQVAVLMGVSEGLLNETSMGSVDFAKNVLGKKVEDTTGSTSKVNFVELTTDSAAIEEVILATDILADVLPGLDTTRKEPLFSKPNHKVKSKATKGIKKERLGLNLAADSVSAMEKLMDTEMVADMTLVRFLIAPENKDRALALLGHIALDSDAFMNLSYKEQQVQGSKNRALENAMAHMEWLDTTSAGDAKVSMWFNYFFSKNGRFFIDSNTINPQTDKHFSRFFVQPKDHNNTYTKSKDGSFKVEGKDVTSLVHYALAQAFGLATDKLGDPKIEAFSKKIIKSINSMAKLNKYREEFLTTGKVESLGIELEHFGHALQAFAFLENTIKAKGKPFDSAISAEFDAVTSGFALKLLQMPIIGKLTKKLPSAMVEWLDKVGIVINSSRYLDKLGDKAPLSMNNLLDTKGFLDSYQFLASSIKPTTYKKLKSSSNSPLLTDEGYPKALWQAVSKVLPSVDPGEAVDSSLRSLFKSPFMTFNYAASIKSIRTRLKTTMTDEVAAKIAKLDLSAVEQKPENAALIAMLTAYVGNTTSKTAEEVQNVIEDIQQKVRISDINTVKVGKGASLGHYLELMIDASYGKQVEEVLTAKFKPFVAAQDIVNDSFKAMFEVFDIAFQEKLLAARQNGPVSAVQEKEIYESLKNQWPAIKGPLSNMEEEFSGTGDIGVYSLDTASPYGVFAGRKASQVTRGASNRTSKTGKTLTTSHMIKKISAAISAGAVIPIHYIDGAVMAKTVLNHDGSLLTIHDAIIPSLTKMSEGQKAYNKATVDVSMDYSFINEIMKSLDRVIENTELFGEVGNPTVYQKAKVAIDRTTTSSVSSYIISVRNQMAGLANNVNAARKELASALNEGASIMHMAGTSEGVHTIDDTNKVAYKEIDTYKQIADNVLTPLTEDGKSVTALMEDAANICK